MKGQLDFTDDGNAARQGPGNRPGHVRHAGADYQQLGLIHERLRMAAQLDLLDTGRPQQRFGRAKLLGGPRIGHSHPAAQPAEQLGGGKSAAAQPDHGDAAALPGVPKNIPDNSSGLGRESGHPNPSRLANPRTASKSPAIQKRTITFGSLSPPSVK